MEYLIASIASSAGRKSFTATDLFSFFLSVTFMQKLRIYSARKQVNVDEYV